MKSSNQRNSRRTFLSNLIKGGFIATILFNTPIKNFLSYTKNPKIYFKENPNSIKRQK
ncbi:MAG: hypothetical protein N3F03_09210 [Ignavibacteria bacterium]|nr:hypothetical protein [Ignavibacteria bacterium]